MSQLDEINTFMDATKESLAKIAAVNRSSIGIEVFIHHNEGLYQEALEASKQPDSPWRFHHTTNGVDWVSNGDYFFGGCVTIYRQDYSGRFLSQPVLPENKLKE